MLNRPLNRASLSLSLHWMSGSVQFRVGVCEREAISHTNIALGRCGEVASQLPFSKSMTGQRTTRGFGRPVLRWVWRHTTPGGRALQQRLDRIIAEARAADAGISVRLPRFSTMGTHRQLAHHADSLS